VLLVDLADPASSKHRVCIKEEKGFTIDNAGSLGKSLQICYRLQQQGGNSTQRLVYLDQHQRGLELGGVEPSSLAVIFSTKPGEVLVTWNDNSTKPKEVCLCCLFLGVAFCDSKLFQVWVHSTDAQSNRLLSW
jgi:hypothetical protein